MPLTLLPLALAAAAQAPACANPVAPDHEAARRIAVREIAARPRPGRFVLHVFPDERNPGLWHAWQSPPAVPGRGTIRGGGGISMRIDRCTGAVSNLHYQR